MIPFLVNLLYSVVPFILILGLLVFAHEFGHYWVAKRAGMKVQAFAIGMGPALVSVTGSSFFGALMKGLRGSRPLAVASAPDGADLPVDQTVYSICAVPIGGYVKIAGMNPDEDPNEPGAFNTKPWGWRFVTLIAGCVMNFVLAALLFCLLGTFIGFPSQNVIDKVLPGSPAQQAGIRPGDRLIGVNDVHTDDVTALMDEIASQPEKPVAVSVRRGQQTLSLTLTPAKTGRIGITFTPAPDGIKVTSRVDTVAAGSPAQKAGLKSGDRIVGVDRLHTDDVSQLREQIESHPGRPITLSVLRGKETLLMALTPETVAEGRLGAEFTPTPVNERVNPAQALSIGVQKTWWIMGEMVHFLGRFIRGRLPQGAQLGGPVAIFKQTGQVARKGIDDLVNWAAMLSINLGIINLLPIPALDGGRLIFLLVEAVRGGRRVDPRMEAYVHLVGLVVLLLVMGVITFHDIVGY